VVEYLGDELLEHLRTGGSALVAKLPADCCVEAGEERRCSVPLKQVRLFDAKSEEQSGNEAMVRWLSDPIVDRTKELLHVAVASLGGSRTCGLRVHVGLRRDRQRGAASRRRGVVVTR
jgi:hypothetical protein